MHRKPPTKTRIGKICPKHPELNGLRRPSRTCIGCYREYMRRYGKRYHPEFRSGSGLSRAGVEAVTSTFVGICGEELVAHDLHARGLYAYSPIKRNGPHDLCVYVGFHLVTIQVKTAKVLKSTGRIHAPHYPCKIKSDLIAVVDLVDRRVRYIVKEGKQVPDEIRDLASST